MTILQTDACKHMFYSVNFSDVFRSVLASCSGAVAIVLTSLGRICMFWADLISH